MSKEVYRQALLKISNKRMVFYDGDRNSTYSGRYECPCCAVSNPVKDKINHKDDCPIVIANRALYVPEKKEDESSSSCTCKVWDNGGTYGCVLHGPNDSNRMEYK